MTNLKPRLYTLGAVLIIAVLGATGYVWNVRQDQAESLANAPQVATAGDPAALRGQPHVVFRNTAAGESYGKVAVVPLADPDGPRAFTPASCERVYATADDAVCLSAERGLVTSYKARVLDSTWQPTQELSLTGIPSRTRLSRDGTLAATTTFVFGDSYANPVSSPRVPS